MKALTLWQPWASAIAAGLKEYETRGWATTYRGLLAIHASKSVPRKAIEWIGEERYRRLCHLVEEAAGGPLPSSCIVTVGRVSGCVPTEQVRPLTDRERSLGDYSRERFAWKLEDVVPASSFEPVPCRGRQGLWVVPDDVREIVLSQFGLTRRRVVLWFDRRKGMHPRDLKPGDVFIQCTDEPALARTFDSRAPRGSLGHCPCWWLAIISDTSAAPENFSMKLSERFGTPTSMVPNMAAIDPRGVRMWMSDAPCRRADEVSFIHVEGMRKIRNMDMGEFFEIGNEIVMHGGIGTWGAIGYSMSGFILAGLPYDQECQLVEMHATWKEMEKS